MPGFDGLHRLQQRVGPRVFFLAGVLASVLFLLLLLWWLFPDAPRPNFSFFERERNEQPNAAITVEHTQDALPKSPDEMAVPVLVGYGEFSALSADRPARGEIRLLRLGTGEHLIRFEQFQLRHAPGLRVYFSAQAAARTPQALRMDFIDLGELKASSGDFHYIIPAQIDIHGYLGIAIYSPVFNELFATAALTPATAERQTDWP